MVVDVLRALGRRWYVVLAGLLLTAGMVFGAYQTSPPDYNARALVLLLPPKADVGKGGNPFLLLSGLEQPAGILAAYFSSAPARAEVEALSPTAEYEVGIDDSTRGPVIAIDVTDNSPAAALNTLDFLLKRIPAELADLQQEVDTRGDAVVGVMSLSVDREAEPDIRGTVRLMIAALVVGLVATGFVAVAIDGYAQRRRQRKLMASEPSSQDDIAPVAASVTSHVAPSVIPPPVEEIRPVADVVDEAGPDVGDGSPSDWPIESASEVAAEAATDHDRPGSSEEGDKSDDRETAGQSTGWTW